MSPDPFRPLHRIDPPDQWDEITRRAGADDDVVVDLAGDRQPSGRRRAVLLVAAAAAVALVGGLVVAEVGDPDEAVTVATDPSTPNGMAGPCPFILDPEAVASPLEPGGAVSEAPAYMGSWRVPQGADLDVPGSQGTLEYGGIPVTVTVYADAASPPPVARQTQGGRTTSDTVEVIAWGPVEGSPACRTAEVRARLPLTDEDRARREREGEDALDLTAYLADPVPSRILGAVRLVPPSDQPAPVADPCGQLAEQDPPAVAEGTADSFSGVLADGRRFTVAVVGTEITVGVDGDDGWGGGSRPDQLASLMWTTTGDDVGIAVGWLPPDAARIGVVRPDGTVTSAGAVTWPEGELFAIPDVGVTPEPDGESGPWPVVRCTADGGLLPADEAAVPADEDPSAAEPGSAATTSTTATAGATATTAPSGAIGWEGQLVDGRTYRVEVDGEVVRAYADGQEVNPGVATAPPAWPTGPDDLDGSSMVGFELSPNPDGGPQDWILVGARPEGAVETWVRGPDGDMVAVRSLTLSPDGRFWALHGLELDFMEVGSPWPVVHTTADGDLVELP